METLPSPETLVERADVAVRRERRFGDEEQLNVMHRQYRRTDGVVVVGVVDDGSVLLVREGAGEPWRLPGSVVGDTDDWAATAREAVAEASGLAVTLEGVDLVERVEYYVDEDAGPELTTDAVHVRATIDGEETDDEAMTGESATGESATGESATGDSATDGVDSATATDSGARRTAWFDAVPEDVDPDSREHVERLLKGSGNSPAAES